MKIERPKSKQPMPGNMPRKFFRGWFLTLINGNKKCLMGQLRFLRKSEEKIQSELFQSLLTEKLLLLNKSNQGKKPL